MQNSRGFALMNPPRRVGDIETVYARIIAFPSLVEAQTCPQWQKLQGLPINRLTVIVIVRRF
jgi:hypothetical protein